MTVKLTTTEIRKMTDADLLQEAATRRGAIAKLKIHVRLGKEKDTAQVKRERRMLARILTIIGQKAAEKPASGELKQQAKTSTLPARAATKRPRGGTSSRSKA